MQKSDKTESTKNKQEGANGVLGPLPTIPTDVSRDLSTRPDPKKYSDTAKPPLSPSRTVLASLTSISTESQTSLTQGFLSSWSLLANFQSKTELNLLFNASISIATNTFASSVVYPSINLMTVSAGSYSTAQATSAIGLSTVVLSSGVASARVLSAGFASPGISSPRNVSPSFASAEVASLSPHNVSPGISSPGLVSPWLPSAEDASSSLGIALPGISSSRHVSPSLASAEFASSPFDVTSQGASSSRNVSPSLAPAEFSSSPFGVTSQGVSSSRHVSPWFALEEAASADVASSYFVIALPGISPARHVSPTLPSVEIVSSSLVIASPGSSSPGHVSPSLASAELASSSLVLASPGILSPGHVSSSVASLGVEPKGITSIQTVSPLIFSARLSAIAASSHYSSLDSYLRSPEIAHSTQRKALQNGDRSSFVLSTSIHNTPLTERRLAPTLSRPVSSVRFEESSSLQPSSNSELVGFKTDSSVIEYETWVSSELLSVSKFDLHASKNFVSATKAQGVYWKPFDKTGFSPLPTKMFKIQHSTVNDVIESNNSLISCNLTAFPLEELLSKNQDSRMNYSIANKSMVSTQMQEQCVLKTCSPRCTGQLRCLFAFASLQYTNESMQIVCVEGNVSISLKIVHYEGNTARKCGCFFRRAISFGLDSQKHCLDEIHCSPGRASLLPRVLHLIGTVSVSGLSLFVAGRHKEHLMLSFIANTVPAASLMSTVIPCSVQIISSSFKPDTFLCVIFSVAPFFSFNVWLFTILYVSILISIEWPGNNNALKQVLLRKSKLLKLCIAFLSTLLCLAVSNFSFSPCSPRKATPISEQAMIFFYIYTVLVCIAMIALQMKALFRQQAMFSTQVHPTDVQVQMHEIPAPNLYTRQQIAELLTKDMHLSLLSSVMLLILFCIFWIPFLWAQSKNFVSSVKISESFVIAAELLGYAMATIAPAVIILTCFIVSRRCLSDQSDFRVSLSNCSDENANEDV